MSHLDKHKDKTNQTWRKTPPWNTLMGDKQTAEACWVSCRLIGRHVRLLAENFKELRWGRTSGSSGVVRGRQGASGGVRGHQGSSDKYNTFLTGGQFLMYKCFWELWFHFGTFRILWTSVRFSWGVATNWYKERYYLFTHWKVLLKILNHGEVFTLTLIYSLLANVTN